MSLQHTYDQGPKLTPSHPKNLSSSPGVFQCDSQVLAVQADNIYTVEPNRVQVRTPQVCTHTHTHTHTHTDLCVFVGPMCISGGQYVFLGASVYFWGPVCISGGLCV